MTRRARSDSAVVASAALRGASVGVQPPSFVRLRDCDKPFWDSIVRARVASDWAQSDLVHVGNLARCMADIERSQALIEREGDTLPNSRGTIIVNPRHSLLETLSRRAMALTRLLQLHAAAKGVDTRDQAARKTEALKANAALGAAAEADDDLLARPTMQ